MTDMIHNGVMTMVLPGTEEIGWGEALNSAIDGRQIPKVAMDAIAPAMPRLIAEIYN